MQGETRLIRFFQSFPWPVIFAFLAVTAFFGVKMLDIRVSYDTADLLPLNVESMDGFQAMGENFPKGQLYPIKIVLKFEDPLSSPGDPMYDLTRLQHIENFAQAIEQEFSITSDGETLVSQINTVTRPNGVPVNFSEALDPLTLGLLTQFVGPATNSTVVLFEGFFILVGKIFSLSESLLSVLRSKYNAAASWSRSSTAEYSAPLK